MTRPSLEEVFLQMAAVLAQRALCNKRQVACILVDSRGHIVSTGYNGRPKAMGNCHENLACLKNCEGVHAEVNALLQAKREAVAAYITHAPCWHCAKTLVNSGVDTIVYINESTLEPATIKFLTDAGIDCRKGVLL